MWLKKSFTFSKWKFAVFLANTFGSTTIWMDLASKGLVVRGPTWLTESRRFSHAVNLPAIVVPRVSKPWKGRRNMDVWKCLFSKDRWLSHDTFLFPWLTSFSRKDLLNCSILPLPSLRRLVSGFFNRFWPSKTNSPSFPPDYYLSP